MPDEDHSKFHEITAAIKKLNDSAEAARNEGDSEILREALERKRHLQNRLAFLKKANDLDEEYYRKHPTDET